MESYQTVRQEAAGFYEVKRSKFHCYACPVTTQEEAQAFVQKIRAKHWDARHNVPAYVLRDGNLQHFSDDGEPSGTAGRPILDVILGHDVTDVVVVITRYFGGVLLGTGGLVRAYSHSAELALEAAGILTMAKMARCSLNVDYGLYGRLPALVAEHAGRVEDAAFGADVSLTILLPTDTVEGFRKELLDLSAGRCDLTVLGEEYTEL